MKHPLAALLLVMALPLGLPAWADMAHMNHATTADQAALGDMIATGVVRKVDKAQGKLTIKHGPLANLDMPAMTMVFRVKDPAMLDRVKAGDNIHFRAERMHGVLTVTQIDKSH